MPKFALIISDPPWNYSNRPCNGAAINHYSTMSTRDICALKVQDVVADDSVLLLWATWPKLVDAFEVIKAWGFEYVTGLPWIKISLCEKDLWNEWHIKPHYGIGFWVRGVSEPLLICRRGNVKASDQNFIGLLSPNIQHSQKPENVYEYAETFPGPYLEMFARRKRPGWSVFGNEVDSDIKL